MENNYLLANILLHDLQRWCKYTFTYPTLLQEYSYLRKQVRSHDTVSKVAYVSNFTYVSKCVHVNGALDLSCLFNFMFMISNGPCYHFFGTYRKRLL